MARLMTEKRLVEENQRYTGTGGVSEMNRCQGFVPAFCDYETGRTELSRFADGSPAPIHLIAALPDDWVVERDHTGRAAAVKGTVIAGFLLDGKFYTREQAARVLYH